MALTDGLIAGWNFNELSGTNCADIKETYDGTAVGASVDTSLKKLGAASRILDGLNDHVDIGISPLFQESATAVSISTWIYVDPVDFNATLIALADTAAGNVAGGGVLVVLDDRGGANPTEGIKFGLLTAGGNEFRNSNNNVISSTGWYLVVGTYDSTDFSKIYVNGVDETGTRTSSGSGNFVPKNAELWLGETNSGLWDFKGNMDSTYIWNRAITAAEVTELWNGGAGLELGTGAIAEGNRSPRRLLLLINRGKRK